LSVIRRSINMAFPRSLLTSQHPETRECHAVPQLPRPYRSLPEPWLSPTSALQYPKLARHRDCWPRHPAVAPALSLASVQNAMAERMESAHRHAGKRCKRKSPDHSVSVSRSHVGTLKLSNLLTCTSSSRVENQFFISKIDLPYYDQI
jgi:hypothetical protein